MNIKLKALGLSVALALLAGCASQTTPIKTVANTAGVDAQKQAQEAAMAQMTAPTLKRKIALGRVTNETSYGKSLLRDSNGDVLGKQVSDMLMKALTQSGQFTVLERTDLAALNQEAALSGEAFQAVGADILVIGSLTEFGRRNQGQSGFLSSNKQQAAYAKMDVRVVDTRTGRVLFSTSGSGEATNTSSTILGFGGRSSYDGTLNDKAISQAVSEVVSGLVSGLKDRPWKTYFLSLEPGQLVISGGKLQGLKPGMDLVVKTQGEKVKSAQTGFMIQIPGKEVARIQVVETFGDDAETEGSIVRVVSGSLAKYKPNQLVVEEVK